MEPLNAVESLARTLGVDWPAVAAARQRAATTRATLAAAVQGVVPPDTSVVVFGSLARGELTGGSDVDWTLLVDGQAYANHRDVAAAVEAAVGGLGLNTPGREGTCGGLACSHDLGLRNVDAA